MRRRERFAWIPILVAALAAVPAVSMAGAIPALASTVQLTRYPYLTDVVTTNATVNWATDVSQTAGYATYGAVGTEACTAHRANGSKTNIAVNGVAEQQWKAMITGLTPGTQYCYRLFFSTPVVDLLGSDPSPQFWSMVPAGSSAPVTFAVTADWGATGADGTNSEQANLDQQIAASGASFVLGAGDTAYPGGSQTNYGDLNQTGADISSVFGPNFWKNVGDSLPMFNALGNHGSNATHLGVWPQAAAVASSGGRYQMDTYPSVNGSAPFSYPSAWYAFDAGGTRIYVLDAAWSNGNLGTGTLYSNDNAAHWAASTPQYQWLASDLAAHPGGLKFAVMHFPMYADSPTESTDPYMHGPGSPGALLSQYGVQFVFNGHAHFYERNTAQPGESFVSYVVGGGGETLEPVSGCGSYDAYAVGWSPTKSQGSACGTAPIPTAASQVFSFLKVSVNGTQVTIAPTDGTGRTFDVQTYTIGVTSVPGVPAAPTAVNATAGDAQALVSFTAPASDGGSPITGYTITPSPACSTCTGTTPTGSSATVAGLTNGTSYTFTVKATNASGTGTSSAASNSITPAATTPTTTPPPGNGGPPPGTNGGPPPGANLDSVIRLAGADRFGTAAAISQAEFPNGKAGAVVLARGDQYPDALVAAPLAAAKNAPLLLTVGSSLPTVTKAELQRALPTGGTVYILGGTGAVPASVASELIGLGYQIVRYGGADRFATAVKVADALGDPATVLLATGTNFPDALSAGVAAAKAGGVVLLTNGASLPSATSGYLSAHGKTIYAIGGPAAQADSGATALVGVNRYATSVAVAEKFFTGPSIVGVASGMAFPDALSGGSFLAHAGGPLMLAASDSLPTSVGTYLSSVKSSIGSTYLFGGSSALAVAAQTSVRSALGL